MYSLGILLAIAFGGLGCRVLVHVVDGAHEIFAILQLAGFHFNLISLYNCPRPVQAMINWIERTDQRLYS